ncbi:hypothetical protein [Bradyrhizobium septentrionale]|uniref:Uncharacterized protein n=1 Tax=Bradyrhizobium septentrionale TaxID=1404411 RepID=A0ABZ2NNS5_9BRAD
MSDHKPVSHRPDYVLFESKRMTPIEYLSRREAIEIIAAAKCAGVPDRDVVSEMRQNGIDVEDGKANDDANAEIWSAVDQNKVQTHIYGPGDRWLKMSPFETGLVPLLRSPRGGDFMFLRPGNSLHERITAEFGPRRLGLLKLVFRKVEIEKLAGLVRRRQRRAAAPKPGSPAIGRPSRRDQVRDCVRQQIEEGHWNTSRPLKALVQLVQRSLKWDKGLSESTVARALDGLHESNPDHKFQRPRRKPRNISAIQSAV